MTPPIGRETVEEYLAALRGRGVTRKEAEVAALLCRELRTCREMARELDISVSAVKKRLGRLRKKVGEDTSRHAAMRIEEIAARHQRLPERRAPDSVQP